MRKIKTTWKIIIDVFGFVIAFSPEIQKFTYIQRNNANKYISAYSFEYTHNYKDTYKECLDEINEKIKTETTINKAYYKEYSIGYILVDVVSINKDYVKIKYKDDEKIVRKSTHQNYLIKKTKLSTTKINKIKALDKQIEIIENEKRKIDESLKIYKF